MSNCVELKSIINQSDSQLTSQSAYWLIRPDEQLFTSVLNSFTE